MNNQGSNQLFPVQLLNMQILFFSKVKLLHLIFSECLGNLSLISHYNLFINLLQFLEKQNAYILVKFKVHDFDISLLQ